MKRIGKKTKSGLKLKRRLDLVRTTIRDLTPMQLQQVNGGTDTIFVTFNCPCGNIYTREW